MMKSLIAVCLFCISIAAFGEDTSLAGTTSVLTTEKAAAATQETATATAVVVSEECTSSDCRVRRRVLGRGYVVVKHSVSGNTATTTREVVDGCCNTVRVRAVTKTKCACR